ncbi:MAG: chromate transporter [Rikenellaceae bacterium]
MIYLQLIISFLKIGFFGFGGGYAMLSFIQQEVVIRNAWISGAEMADIIAISQMTPGPIAINSATYTGYVMGGFLGAVVATLAVCTPALTLMVLITRFFLLLRNNPYVSNVMVALRPVIVAMIAAAGFTMILPSQQGGGNFIDVWSWVLFAVAFAASCVKRISPILIIVAAAVAGVAIYYLPTII